MISPSHVDAGSVCILSNAVLHRAPAGDPDDDGLRITLFSSYSDKVHEDDEYQTFEFAYAFHHFDCTTVEGLRSIQQSLLRHKDRWEEHYEDNDEPVNRRCHLTFKMLRRLQDTHVDSVNVGEMSVHIAPTTKTSNGATVENELASFTACATKKGCNIPLRGQTKKKTSVTSKELAKLKSDGHVLQSVDDGDSWFIVEPLCPAAYIKPAHSYAQARFKDATGNNIQSNCSLKQPTSDDSWAYALTKDLAKGVELYSDERNDENALSQETVDDTNDDPDFVDSSSSTATRRSARISSSNQEHADADSFDSSESARRSTRKSNSGGDTVVYYSLSQAAEKKKRTKRKRHEKDDEESVESSTSAESSSSSSSSADTTCLSAAPLSAHSSDEPVQPFQRQRLCESANALLPKISSIVIDDDGDDDETPTQAAEESSAGTQHVLSLLNNVFDCAQNDSATARLLRMFFNIHTMKAVITKLAQQTSDETNDDADDLQNAIGNKKAISKSFPSPQFSPSAKSTATPTQTSSSAHYSWSHNGHSGAIGNCPEDGACALCVVPCIYGGCESDTDEHGQARSDFEDLNSQRNETCSSTLSSSSQSSSSSSLAPSASSLSQHSAPSRASSTSSNAEHPKLILVQPPSRTPSGTMFPSILSQSARDLSESTVFTMSQVILAGLGQR